MDTNGPEYTRGKREIYTYCDDTQTICVETTPDGGNIIANPPAVYNTFSRKRWSGNARLSAASDNAVLELAERLGVNAVLLSERLEGGGLVRLVEALKEIRFVTDRQGVKDAADKALSVLSLGHRPAKVEVPTDMVHCPKCDATLPRGAYCKRMDHCPLRDGE